MSESKGNVLLVEDNADMRDVLAMLLSQLGWKVTSAKDGIDGLRQLRDEQEPDVIITDYMMPQLDGLAMTAHIKQCPNVSVAPILLISAAEVACSPTVGPDAYLKKPIDAHVLHQKLEELTGAPAERHRY